MQLSIVLHLYVWDDVKVKLLSTVRVPFKLDIKDIMLGQELQCTTPYVLVYILVLVEHARVVFVCAGQLLEKHTRMQAGLYMCPSISADRNEMNLLATTNAAVRRSREQN